MPDDLSELERLLDEADWKVRQREQRTRLSRGVFNAHRKRQLADLAGMHPLRRVRLTFRDDGLTVEELAQRAMVGANTIRDLERGKPGSDLSWARLAHALGGIDRRRIDPRHVYTG